MFKRKIVSNFASYVHLILEFPCYVGTHILALPTILHLQFVFDRYKNGTWRFLTVNLAHLFYVNKSGISSSQMVQMLMTLTVFPSTDENFEAVTKIVMENRQITIRVVSESVNISIGLCHLIVD